jgi:glycosyltransferase involved in cell wall biosynthesis
MKILHIISSGGMYGAEAVILNLSRTLKEASHASVLAVFSNSANPNLQLRDVAMREGIECHVISCEGQIDRKVVTSIRDLVAKTKPDIVHAHGYKADIYVYFALRNPSTALVSTCHTWYDNNLALTLYGVADRFALKSYAAIVAVSEEVRQRLVKAGVRKDRIHMVRNGIDLRPFTNAQPVLRNDTSSDVPIVGLIGRLSVEKGVDIFLRAAAQVAAVLPATKFIVVGEGADRSKLESLIDELDIRKHVSMLGQRDDMPSIYASLDMMVSSSRHEGLPMAILEGMASSLPIIATPVGDVPTVVMDGRTGLMVPADDPALLASSIIALLQNPDRRKLLGTTARKLIEDEFSAERMTADYLRVYHEASDTKMQKL